MGAEAGVFCDCGGPPFGEAHGKPWQEMIRLHVGGELSRFYLCRKCGAIREDVCRPDGTITSTPFDEAHGRRYHEMESVDGSTGLSEILPAAAVEQAREILERPVYQQGALFDVDFS